VRKAGEDMPFWQVEQLHDARAALHQQDSRVSSPTPPLCQPDCPQGQLFDRITVENSAPDGAEILQI